MSGAHSPTSVIVDGHEEASSSSPASSSTTCRSVPTSEQTSCSVIFIEGRTIPEINVHGGLSTNDTEAGEDASPSPPSAEVRFVHRRRHHHEEEGGDCDCCDSSVLTAHVSRRMSSITMPGTPTAATTTPSSINSNNNNNPISPLLVHGIKIPLEATQIREDDVLGATNNNTMGAHAALSEKGHDDDDNDHKTKKGLLMRRGPTPISSASERNWTLEEAERSSICSGDEDCRTTTTPHTTATTCTRTQQQKTRKELTLVLLPHLFSVQEDDSSDHNNTTAESHVHVASFQKKTRSIPQAEEQEGHHTRVDSEVTTKASNTTENVVDCVLQGRRKKQRDPMLTTTTSSPRPSPQQGSRKFPRDAPGLAPPKRVDSPLPKRTLQDVPEVSVGNACAIRVVKNHHHHHQRPTPTIEVENRLLRDASNEPGLYTGSMDTKTLLPDGFGTMIYNRHGQEYTGDWEQGIFHGYGKHINARVGDIYDGPFVNGIKEGKEDGIMIFRDGRRFHGRFHADKMREGVLQFKDGSYYEGLLENDKRNGFGLYCFENGDQYEGQWKNDKMHGRGRMEWTVDGISYNGEWEAGIQQGMGTEIDAKGRIIHQGRFHHGKPVTIAEPVYADD